MSGTDTSGRVRVTARSARATGLPHPSTTRPTIEPSRPPAAWAGAAPQNVPTTADIARMRTPRLTRGIVRRGRARAVAAIPESRGERNGLRPRRDWRNRPPSKASRHPLNGLRGVRRQAQYSPPEVRGTPTRLGSIATAHAEVDPFAVGGSAHDHTRRHSQTPRAASRFGRRTEHLRVRGNRRAGLLGIGNRACGWVTPQFEADDVAAKVRVQSLGLDVEPRRLLAASARERRSEKAESNCGDDSSHRPRSMPNETRCDKERVRRRLMERPAPASHSRGRGPFRWPLRLAV